MSQRLEVVGRKCTSKGACCPHRGMSTGSSSAVTGDKRHQEYRRFLQVLLSSRQRKGRLGEAMQWGVGRVMLVWCLIRQHVCVTA